MSAKKKGIKHNPRGIMYTIGFLLAWKTIEYFKNKFGRRDFLGMIYKRTKFG